MRRSGHHAVLNWIRWQCPGHHLFLNDGAPGENPFATCSQWSSRAGWGQKEHRRIPWAAEIRGDHSRRGALLYSYEERDFAEVITPGFEENRTKWVGDSDQRFDVLILRDPYNLMASRMKWAEGKAGDLARETMTSAMPLWKSHAREFLGETTNLPESIPISYNAWFADKEYRRKLAAQIGVPFTDRGVAEVARWGPTMIQGDSFDGLSYDGQATEMKVLERWRNYWDRSEFREFFDRDVIELSECIFGPILDEDALSDLR